MPFCPSCGTPMQPADHFCPSCGAPARAGAAAPGGTPHSAASAGLTDNGAAVLCYAFGLVTGIIFLVLQPWSRNPTVRFHAFQSIFFNIAVVAIHIVFTVLAGLLVMGAPMAAAGLMLVLQLLLWLGFVALWILLMVKAYTAKPLVLPLIGPLAERVASKAGAGS